VEIVNAQDIPGVDQTLANDLKAELLRVLAIHWDPKQVASPPMTEQNQVNDLAAVDDGSGGADLNWSYRSTGDYDQNGEAGISDITPVGVHFKKTTASPDWAAAQLADGDENGEVNAADLTPLGVNFGNQVRGYKVFTSMDEADYPADPDGANGAGAVDAGDVLLSAATPWAGGRLRFEFNVTSHIPGCHYWVRPYDADGALGAASNNQKLGAAASTWTHTWGFDAYDDLADLAYHPEGAVYAVGKTNSLSALYNDLLLLKYDLEGNLIWARTWGGSEFDFATSVSVGSEGEIYVGGNTTSYGEGEQDVLLQRWESDGSLTWTKTWGNAGDEYANTVSYMQNAVYVSGFITLIGTSHADVLVLKFDPTGDLDWARSLGAVGGVEWANDMQTHWSFSANATTIHLTGLAESYSTDPAILYAKVDEDGDAQAVSVWSGGFTEGYGISVQGALADEIYICGKDSINLTTLLLEYSAAPGATRTSWSHPDQAKLYELLRVDSNLILCGSYGFEGGLVLNLSLAGALQGSETWLPVAGIPHLSTTCYIPGFGIAGCGYANAAAGGTWGSTTGSLDSVAGTWNTVADTTEAVTGVISSPSVAPAAPTGAVIDAGGGDRDALVFMRPLS